MHFSLKFCIFAVLNNKYKTNEYTIKVADYDGGNYIEKKITSNNDTSNVSNSITNKEDSNSNAKNTKTNNPNTHDNIIKYVIISLFSTFSILSLIIFIKKHRNIKNNI